jgi:hypothetical protein
MSDPRSLLSSIASVRSRQLKQWISFEAQSSTWLLMRLPGFSKGRSIRTVSLVPLRMDSQLLLEEE